MAVDILPPEQRSLSWSPHSWAQEAFFFSEAPDLLYSGRLGSGKTTVCCQKADHRCWAYKDARVAVTRRYREDIGASILPVLLDKTITPAHRDWGYAKGDEGGSTLHYPTGSSIIVLGLNRPAKLQSTEFDLILIEQAEEITQDQWDYASGRLRNKAFRILDDDSVSETETAYLQIAGACNPDTPQHFLFRRFRPDLGSHRIWSDADTTLRDGRVVPAGDLVADCVCAGLLDGMEFLDPKYLARLERKTGPYYKRMVLGQWAAIEGAVWDCFDRDFHVRRRPRAWDEWGGYPPASYERVRAIDFGYVDPFVCLWLARSAPYAAWWMYREIYMSKRTVPHHATVIQREEEKELQALRQAAERHGHRIPNYINLIGSYADHDAGDRATLSEEGDIVTSAAFKDRSPGFQFVYEALAPHEVTKRMRCGLYFVEPRTIDGQPGSLVEVDDALEAEGFPICTIEEIPGYRHDPDKPGKDKTVGVDHGCLVAGTMVETDSGPAPIESIRLGHRVRTREGWMPVSDAAMTNPRAAVGTVAFSNGAEIKGTGDHPVWTAERGWVRLDALRYGDTVVACHERACASRSTASTSTDTPTPTRCGPSGATGGRESATGAAESKPFTEKSGSSRTGQSRAARSSITSTATRSTTSQGISPAWRHRCTPRCTSRRRSAWNCSASTSARLRRSLRHGIGRRLGSHGIERTPRHAASENGSHGCIGASTAATDTRPPSARVPGSAAPTASRRGGARLAWTAASSGRAFGVRPISRPTNTGPRGSAPEPVRVVTEWKSCGTREPVYNLTVEGDHEYFANGILTHNCDALRYGVSSVRKQEGRREYQAA